VLAATVFDVWWIGAEQEPDVILFDLIRGLRCRVLVYALGQIKSGYNCYIDR
jgi:hypothetical protein